MPKRNYCYTKAAGANENAKKKNPHLYYRRVKFVCRNRRGKVWMDTPTQLRPDRFSVINRACRRHRGRCARRHGRKIVMWGDRPLLAVTAKMAAVRTQMPRSRATAPAHARTHTLPAACDIIAHSRHLRQGSRVRAPAQCTTVAAAADYDVRPSEHQIFTRNYTCLRAYVHYTCVQGWLFYAFSSPFSRFKPWP